LSVLKNARHEKFAQLVATKGKSAAEAYRLAGYKADRGAATRLSANVSVKARILELKERSAERAEIDAERVLRELALIAFANADDYFEWNGGNVTLKNSDEMTREQKAVVSEISQTVTEAGGTIRLKLYDKRAALVDLGKHLGIFKDQDGGAGLGAGGIHLHLHGADASL